MACWQAVAFRMPAAQLEKDGWWATPPCCGVQGERTIFPWRSSRELWIIKWCSMKKVWCWPWPSRGVPSILECSRGVLSNSTRAPNMPHPLLERGDLLDLNILDALRKDPMTPAPAERASSLRPRAEEPISVPATSKPTALEPEEAAQQEQFALVLRRRPLNLPVFILSLVDESGPPSLKEADWFMSILLGVQLDFASLRFL